MGIAAVDPGDSVAEHYHPYSEEFVYVVKGRLDLYADDERHELSAGQGVVLPINTRHRLVNAGTEEVQIVFQLGPLAPRPELGHVDTEHERLDARVARADSAGVERHATTKVEADVGAARVPRFWSWLAAVGDGLRLRDGVRQLVRQAGEGRRAPADAGGGR